MSRNVHPNREVSTSDLCRPTHKQSIALEPEYFRCRYITNRISVRAMYIGYCIRLAGKEPHA